MLRAGRRECRRTLLDKGVSVNPWRDVQEEKRGLAESHRTGKTSGCFMPDRGRSGRSRATLAMAWKGGGYVLGSRKDPLGREAGEPRSARIGPGPWAYAKGEELLSIQDRQKRREQGANVSTSTGRHAGTTLQRHLNTPPGLCGAHGASNVRKGAPEPAREP